MPAIFVSYRREDSAAITGRVHDRLVADFDAGSVVMDVDTIPYGADFRQYLSKAIAKCDVLLAIIGDRWLERSANGKRRLDDPEDFVRIEIEAALREGIQVIPVLIGSVAMPNEDELPEAIADLAYRNAARIDPGIDFHHHVDRLIRNIQALFSSDPISASQSTEPAPFRDAQHHADTATVIQTPRPVVDPPSMNAVWTSMDVLVSEDADPATLCNHWMKLARPGRLLSACRETLKSNQVDILDDALGKISSREGTPADILVSRIERIYKSEPQYLNLEIDSGRQVWALWSYLLIARAVFFARAGHLADLLPFALRACASRTGSAISEKDLVEQVGKLKDVLSAWFPIDRKGKTEIDPDIILLSLGRMTKDAWAVGAMRDCCAHLMGSEPRPKLRSSSIPVLGKEEAGFVAQLCLELVPEGTAEFFAEPIRMDSLPLTKSFLRAVEVSFKAAGKLVGWPYVENEKPFDVRWWLESEKLDVLDHDSFGAAMAIALVLLLRNEVPPQQDWSVSAGVTEQGALTPVEHISAKAKACFTWRDSRKVSFLVVHPDNETEARDAVSDSGLDAHSRIRTARTVAEAITCIDSWRQFQLEEVVAGSASVKAMRRSIWLWALGLTFVAGAVIWVGSMYLQPPQKIEPRLHLSITRKDRPLRVPRETGYGPLRIGETIELRPSEHEGKYRYILSFCGDKKAEIYPEDTFDDQDWEWRLECEPQTETIVMMVRDLEWSEADRTSFAQRLAQIIPTPTLRENTQIIWGNDDWSLDPKTKSRGPKRSPNPRPKDWRDDLLRELRKESVAFSGRTIQIKR